MTRTNFTDLTNEQRITLGQAFNRLWELGRIQSNANLHDINFTRGIHWGPAFLPWHRDFLRKIEIGLQEYDPSISLPYWDWTRADSRNIDISPWEEFCGGRDNDGGMFDSWDYRRNETDRGIVLPSLDDIIEELDKDSFATFRALESGSHTPGHRWTGGDMASGTSPIDPLFYLHHCNLDRLWAIWQLNNPDVLQYEHLTNIGLNDRVDGARVPIDSPMIEGAEGEEGVTPRSVLNHLALNYTYQRDERLENAWFEQKGTQLITNAAQLPA